MSDLTDDGQRIMAEVAARRGLSPAAVEEMARALARGGGTMAQFNIPELGGSGQWMAGGMTMVGDMFNNGLKAQVDGLCAELAAAMGSQALFRAPQASAGMGGAWWPRELGQPASSGGQNTVRYAYFPDARRIAFDPGTGAPVVLLDTLDHRIGGFGQQQSGPGDPYLGISFSSQFGQFALSSLPQAALADDAAPPAATHTPAGGPGPTPPPPPAVAVADVPPAPQTAPGGTQDVLSMIERLAALRAADVLTAEEFAAKKAELLARL